jgi:hypothetical protein
VGFAFALSILSQPTPPARVLLSFTYVENNFSSTSLHSNRKLVLCAPAYIYRSSLLSPCSSPLPSTVNFPLDPQPQDLSLQPLCPFGHPKTLPLIASPLLSHAKITTAAMNGAANASCFWAQKSREVKTSTARTRALSSAVKAHGAIAEVKDRRVHEGKPPTAALTASTHRNVGMANGALLTLTPKKHDWADSEDDDSLASFSAQKSPHITALENEVAHKDARIEALESVVESKDVRIVQLEDVVEEKEQRIISLVTDAQESDAEIEKLRSDNHTQFLYVQELVGEVDEKTRRIQELETELDNKGAHIHELETDSESQTRVSFHNVEKENLLDTAERDVAAPIAADQGENTPEPEATPLVSSVTAPKETDATIKNADKGSTQYVLSAISPNHEYVGPTIYNSNLPKLWSPDMVKKVAPVEKPKVLKMAIDTSKFGKKHLQVVKNPEPVNAKGLFVPTYGQSTKHLAKTDVVPKIQVDKDIRHMPHAERVLFANGSEVAVMLGTTKLATLPKYILMQCSSRAHQYFTEHPDGVAITFPVGSMDVEAAKAHLQWMDEMTYQGRVYSLTLNADEKFDSKNLKICQAARVLGLNNTYVGHFTKILCDRVRSNNLSMESMSLICELAFPANDPIFDCLANNLVNQQRSKSAKRPEDLETLLANFPLLAVKMSKIEHRVKDSRAGDKRKGSKSQDRSRTHEDDKGWDGEKKRPWMR